MFIKIDLNDVQVQIYVDRAPNYAFVFEIKINDHKYTLKTRDRLCALTLAESLEIAAYSLKKIVHQTKTPEFQNQSLEYQLHTSE